MSQQSSRSTTTHIPALDGVRGVAILLVLLHHCYLVPHPGSWFMQGLYQLSHAAWVGVDLFFVLSGFLITGILMNSVDGDNFFKTFYARRALRIFPLYFLVVIGLLALSIPLGIAWHGRQWLLIGYLQNTGLRQPFDFQLTPVISLNHFWSLSIEEQYYLVWPLLIFCVRGAKKLLLLCLAFSIAALALRFWAAPQMNSAYIFTSTPFRVDALFIGSGLALLGMTDWRAWRERALIPVAAVCVMGIAVISFQNGGFWWADHWTDTVGFSISALSSTVVIALAVRPGWVSKVFRIGGLRFLGRYSYGLYVWHAFVFAAWRDKLSARFGAGVADGGVILISMLVAMASYHWFENPFLRLKDRLSFAGGENRDRRLTAVNVEQ